MSNLTYRHGKTICRKCKSQISYRLHRPAILKLLFPFIPIRVYYCFGCLKKRYFFDKR